MNNIDLVYLGTFSVLALDRVLTGPCTCKVQYDNDKYTAYQIYVQKIGDHYSGQDAVYVQDYEIYGSAEDAVYVQDAFKSILITKTSFPLYPFLCRLTSKIF